MNKNNLILLFFLEANDLISSAAHSNRFFIIFAFLF